MAKSEEAARRVHPDAHNNDLYEYGLVDDVWRKRDLVLPGGESEWEDADYSGWPTRLADVQVTRLGLADKGAVPGIICRSFHAG